MSDADSNQGENGTNGEGPTNIAEETLNRAFSVLAGQYRRYAILALRNSGENGVGIADLADAIVTLDANATDYDGIQTRLHHQTLPSLDEANIIDYDPRTNTIRYRGDEYVEAILDTLPSQDA